MITLDNDVWEEIQIDYNEMERHIEKLESGIRLIRDSAAPHGYIYNLANELLKE